MARQDDLWYSFYVLSIHDKFAAQFIVALVCPQSKFHALVCLLFVLASLLMEVGAGMVNAVLIQ